MILAFPLSALLYNLFTKTHLYRPQAVIIPAKSHPEVIVAAIAARDLKRAQAYAKKHGIPNAHGSYQGSNSHIVIL